MASAPGLYVVPARPPAPLPAAAVDVPAFIGIAERGPLGTSVVVQGWPGFTAVFGGLLDNAQLAWAVRGFFENGGRRCHIVRVAAPFVQTTTTAAAQPADRFSSLVLNTFGFAAGAAVSVTQTIATSSSGAQPAGGGGSILTSIDGFGPGNRVAISQADQPTVWRTLTGLDAASKRAGWDTPLPSGFDLTKPIGFTVQHQTLRLVADVTSGTLHWNLALPDDLSLLKPITFTTGSAAASGTFYDDNGEPVLQVMAASPGAFGNAIEVRLTRTVSAEASTRRVAVPDPADALSIDTLANLAIGATVTLHQTAAPTVRRFVTGIDSSLRRVKLDQPLPGAFDLVGAAAGTKPIALRRETFALSVLEGGTLVETHAGLDLPAAGADLADLTQTSNLIRAIRLAVPSLYPLLDPVSGPGVPGRLTLTGGLDGIAALGAGDLVAALTVLEPVDEPAAVAIPDAQPNPARAVETLPPPVPTPDPCALCPPPAAPIAVPPPVLAEAAPSLTMGDLRAVQQAMIQHCELRADRIALLDAPRDLSQPDPFDPDALRDWRIGLDSRFAALYWPWLRVLDPDNPRAVPRNLPPCGHVLGGFAASDLAFGVQRAPANVPLEWVQSVTRETDDARRGLLNDAGLNVIRILPNRGIRVYGARVLTPEPDYRLLNVRRTLIQLRRALLYGLSWVPFEPDNFALRARLRACIESFLEDFWRRGGLSGATIEQAFAVTFDPPGSAGDGTLVINIAVALVVPAEFVYLTLLRADDAIAMVEPTTIPGTAP